MNEEKKLVFMLVADNDDQFLTRSTLEELPYDAAFRFLSSAAGLFALLEKQVPSVIVADYNLVPETGLQILTRLKSDDRYSSIPVVILTDSSLWKHHAHCYSRGASSVIRKPRSMAMTQHKINTFLDYWINVAETPSG